MVQAELLVQPQSALALASMPVVLVHPFYDAHEHVPRYDLFKFKQDSRMTVQPPTILPGYLLNLDRLVSEHTAPVFVFEEEESAKRTEERLKKLNPALELYVVPTKPHSPEPRSQNWEEVTKRIHAAGQRIAFAGGFLWYCRSQESPEKSHLNGCLGTTYVKLARKGNVFIDGCCYCT